MNLAEIIFLAAALGVDCLVVSFSQGLIFNSNRMKNSLLLAVTMGICQSVMPCFGYFPTGMLSGFLTPFSKLIVFSIFLILGAKFIYEAFQEKEETVCCIGFRCLLGLGIATSIDALASGVSLRLSDVHVLVPVAIIGLTSFFMSLGGFWSASLLKKLPSKTLEISGGIVLIWLAIRAWF